MAASKTNELSATELELKRRGRRRLIGAITLGLLAIVFLPMIFDSEPRRDKTATQEISIQVPPKDGQPALPPPTVTQTPADATPVPEPKPPITPVEDAKTASEAVPAKTPPAKEAPAKPLAKEPAKAAPKSEPAPKAADIKGGFVVQVGAFRDAENAQQLVARMKEAKLPVVTDVVAVSGGKVTRVRVGPYAKREQADAALAQVKLTGADGKIVPVK
jgi:DedD protein